MVERRAAGLGYIIRVTSIEECNSNVNMIRTIILCKIYANNKK